MLLPFGGPYADPQEPETPPVPEVVSIEGLTHDAIEKAEAEIEAEEN